MELPVWSASSDFGEESYEKVGAPKCIAHPLRRRIELHLSALRAPNPTNNDEGARGHSTPVRRVIAIRVSSE